MAYTFNVKDQNGNPVASATCNLRAWNPLDPTTEPVWFSNLTDTNGVAEVGITGWISDKWTVNKTGYVEASGMYPQTIINVTLTSMVPPPTGYGRVEGTARSDQGARIEGATIYVNGLFQCLTDAVGHYGPLQVKTGEWILDVAADPYYEPVTKTITIIEGQTLILDITMKRTGITPPPTGQTFVFIVGDKELKPIQGAYCKLTAHDGGIMDFYGLTNFSGIAYITIPEGWTATVWTVTKEGYLTASGVAAPVIGVKLTRKEEIPPAPTGIPLWVAAAVGIGAVVAVAVYILKRRK